MCPQDSADVPTVRDKQALIDSYDELIRSTEILIEKLRSTLTSNRKTRSQLENGSTIRETFSAIPTGDLRQSLTEALAEVESTRHKVRQLAFARGLAEGMSIGELARMWGISRQLASRYLKEAKART
jgi:DNA-directed RNA polymerase specialized sigma subunit